MLTTKTTICILDPFCLNPGRCPSPADDLTIARAAAHVKEISETGLTFLGGRIMLVPMIEFEDTCEAGAERDVIDKATRAAVRRILSGSGKTMPYLSLAMGYSPRRLEQLMTTHRWPSQAIAALAKVSSQNPVEMLWREWGKYWKQVSLVHPSE